MPLSTGQYSDGQLRAMAKAVTFWEPATARCAPRSRQDNIQGFCKSNIANTNAAKPLTRYGPLRGLIYAFDYIDHASRESIIQYVCPDKYQAWNSIVIDQESITDLECAPAMLLASVLHPNPVPPGERKDVCQEITIRISIILTVSMPERELSYSGCLPLQISRMDSLLGLCRPGGH
ncbi:uncharacterized protein PV06_08381 [Exophiala oligosperma]|uniref:Uncharacterized protein n=1 Tax=Exophiala oligosperma TaxID=215243 RepID=A0A0D2BQK8_9EURO|nr:uncharacterized protein PV06_08381 [Exophiala oligosperma]KIW39797.1 hypothetical protein PV06_08381 [Exophiala oligosperma]